MKVTTAPTTATPARTNGQIRCIGAGVRTADCRGRRGELASCRPSNSADGRQLFASGSFPGVDDREPSLPIFVRFQKRHPSAPRGSGGLFRGDHRHGWAEQPL
jgi:hypothetical protein